MIDMLGKAEEGPLISKRKMKRKGRAMTIGAEKTAVPQLILVETVVVPKAAAHCTSRGLARMAHHVFCIQHSLVRACLQE